MFDASFYTSVLPDLVRQECLRQAGKLPVVEFRLGDGTTLDVCHVVQLAERWMAVAFFRDPKTCEDMDMTFLPYELVMRISVSLHNPKSRRIGFTVSEMEPAAAAAPEAQTQDKAREDTKP